MKKLSDVIPKWTYAGYDVLLGPTYVVIRGRYYKILHRASTGAPYVRYSRTTWEVA